MTERAGTSPRWRSRATRDPMAVRANQNTRQGRRLRDLYAAFMARLDPDDVLARSAALACAELRVAAENCRTAVLADPANTDLADIVVRLEHAADRAEAKLAKFTVTKKPVSLAEHWAHRAAQQAGTS